MFITEWKGRKGNRTDKSIKLSCGANSRVTSAAPIGCSGANLTPDLPDPGTVTGLSTPASINHLL